MTKTILTFFSETCTQALSYMWIPNRSRQNVRKNGDTSSQVCGGTLTCLSRSILL